MVNFPEIIEKIMANKGIANEKDVAKVLEISPQDFSNRKKRGSLLPVVVEWALRENVSIDWLLTGEAGQPRVGRVSMTELEIMLERIEAEGDVMKLQAVRALLIGLDPGEVIAKKKCA